MKTIRRVLFSVVVILYGTLLTGCGKKEINLNDYVNVTFSGCEGYGKATVEFDKEQFETDCEEIKISTANVSAIYENASDYYRDICFSYKLDGGDRLVNGDIVTLKWKADNELVESNTAGSLVYSDITYTVSGLEILPTFDLFADVEVSFSGYSPYTTISISENEPDFVFEVTAVNGETDGYNGYLKDGDVVTVSATSALFGMPLDEYIVTNKKRPESMTKDYQITGVGKYILTLDDITHEIQKTIDETSFETMKGQWEKNYNSPTNYSATLLGMAIGKNDYGAWADVCAIYTISSVDTTEPTYYWGVKINTAKIEEDGTLTYSTVHYPQSGWFSDGVFTAENGLSYIGYESLDALVSGLGMGNYETMDTDIQELSK